MALTLAIVGRPNVGKSTLFNRLAGRKLAIVHGEPGVTRDWREAEGRLGPMDLRLLDTPGLEDIASGPLSGRMSTQAFAALEQADVCLFLLDARDGVTAGDQIIADALHRSGKPVIVAANKIEGRGTPIPPEAWRFGFGEPIALSAEHGLGLADLIEALQPYAPGEAPESAESETGPLKLAIVGRPNVGKSSLFNILLGEARSLTGPEAGITRDAVIARWTAGGRAVLLHDTAGLRKKARVSGHTLEELSVGSALGAIKFAECVIVVVDATQAFEKQDLTIADLIAREGRAIVFALNKWDLVEAKAGAIARLREMRDRLLPQVTGAPLVAVSALTGEGLDRLEAAVLEADRAWNARVPTAQLNRFLEQALAKHAPPAIRGRRVRIRYMTQVKSRPPTFALFGTQLKALPESYLRYLTNALRETFDLAGTPMRFVLRTAKNPYTDV